ncbi:LPS export ABC transporter periplasmic protein LptC [Vandammella animalimorsus]|uniref:LPS export ABC transporter periplasmic protein LptC n=1 Tax=Vandammella animalimorsus TaxID=2029117 RepID=UPI0031BB1624
MPQQHQHKAKRSLRYRLDKLSIYSPMLAMGLLALGSYWLVRNAPQPEVFEAVELPQDEPDYQMRDFVVRNYTPDGQLTLELFGQQGRHYPNEDTLQVDAMRLRAVTESGDIVTATADTGTSTHTRDQQRLHVRLQGNAVVVQHASAGSPRMEFRGEELQLWPDAQRVRSTQPVLLLRGQDRLSGERLDYDRKQRITELQGRVRGVLQPETAARARP